MPDYAYPKHVLKMVAASVCQASGFENVTAHALESLSHVLQMHLEQIGSIAAAAAEAASRTSPNVYDVLFV